MKHRPSFLVHVDGENYIFFDKQKGLQIIEALYFLEVKITFEYYSSLRKQILTSRLPDYRINPIYWDWNGFVKSDLPQMGALTSKDLSLVLALNTEKYFRISA